MKRLFCDLIIIVAFIPLYYLVALPFISELRIEEARAYEQGYGWGNADKMYNKAISINPFNAVHLKEYGNFVSKRAVYEKDKLPMLKKADGLYERALRLNNVDAESRVSLGVTRIQILRSFWFDSAHHKSLPQNDRGDASDQNDNSFGLPRRFAPRNDSVVQNDKAFRAVVRDFRKAIELDPNGYQNNFTTGCSLLTIFDQVGDDDKEFAVYTLKKALELRYWEAAKYIYPYIMEYVKDFNMAIDIAPQTLEGCKGLYYFMLKNELWQYHSKIKKMMDFYRQKEEPEEFVREIEERARLLRSLRSLAMTGALERWTGTSEGGRNEYRDGKMYWTGTAHKAVDMPQGISTITIKARGSIAKGVWPYMIVELDGEEIGEIFVDSEEWKEYSFDVDTDAGIKVLSVTFPNDARDKDKEEDRNLYLGDVVVTRK